MTRPVILVDQGEFVGLSGATSGDVLTWNGTAWVSSPNGTGTVTSVTAGTGLSGGTITTSGTISMPNVGTAGTYGSASSVPVITTDAQGRVTLVTGTPIAIAQSQVANLVSDLAGKVPTTRQVIAGTGLSGGGVLSSNVTLSLPNVGTQGEYGSASSVAVVTTDQQGRVSGATTLAIAIAQSAVADLVVDLASKADKSVTATAGTGLTGGGTLASNFSFALDTVGTAKTDQGSATKTVKISTDAYGRVTALSEQDIGSLPASVISSGQLSLSQGGTGIDASGVTAGQVLVGGTGTLALQNVSQDGSLASDGKLTVTGLQTNAVSATVLGAPDAGKALVWSGSEWQASTIQGGGGGGGLVLYMNYAASSPYPLDTTFDENAGWDTGAITVANDAAGTELARFLTSVAFVIEVIPAGIWDVNVYAQASGALNDTAVRAKVGVWDGSTLTILGTSDYTYLTDPSVLTQYKASVYVPTTDLASGERIAIVIEGRRFAATTQTVTSYFGTGTISHVHSTLNAPGGTGLLKVVDGYLQSPASALVNADVASDAAIAVAKLAAGTNDYVLTTVSGVPTWNPPASGGVSSLTGTADQVLVDASSGTPMTGALTLTLPQSIASTSSPTFAGLTLDAFSGLLRATAGVLSSGASVSLISEVSGTLPILNGGTNLTSSGANGNLLVSDGSVWASVPMTGDATIASTGALALKNTGSAGTYGSASAVPVFVTDAQGRVTGVTNTNIDFAGNTVTSLTGTANQVSVSASTGAVTLSLPSAIAMTSASTAVPLSITAGAASGTDAAGGALSLTGGAATAGNGAGGAVTINAGARFGSGSLGDVNIGAANTNGVVLGGTGGTGVYFNTDIRFNNTTVAIRPSTDNTVKIIPNSGSAVTFAARSVSSGTATAVTVQGGGLSAATGTAGSLTLSGGAGTGTNTSGGSLILRGGAKTGTGTLGAISIGTDSTQTAGVTIGATGITTTINGTAKLATLNATAATITLAATTGAGTLRLESASLLTIQPAESTLGSSFSVSLVGGDNNWATAGGTGGTANITGGAANGTNGNGGNVNIEGGAKTGTGAAGIVFVGTSANTSQIQIGTTGNTTSIGGTLTLDSATVIPGVNGGTGFGSYFKGNILYAAAAGSALSKLSIGSNGEVLAVVAGLPVWRNPVTQLSLVTTSNTDQTIDGIKTFSKSPVLSTGLAVPFVTGSDATGVDYVLYLSPDDLGVSPTTRMAFQPRDSLNIAPRGFNLRGQANELGDGGSIYLDGGAKVVSGTINQAGSGSVLIGTNLNTKDIEIGSANVPTVIKGSLSMSTMKTIITSSSTSASAGLRIPHGADVLSATNGDIWTTGSGLFAYISGVAQQYAPLASPTFTGTPLSTTAAVDVNTTQIATTAYVVGQGYLKSATASSIYAPLASPTFTGTVTIPAGASISGFAPLASPTFTGTVTLPLTTAGYVKTTSGGVISSSATVAVADLSGAVSVANGGTNNASLSVVEGTVYYGDGSQLVGLAPGNSGEFLQTQGAGAAPQWAAGGGGGGGGTVTSVSLDTASTGLTVSGGTSQTITTSGTFTLGGTLALANGGTNANLTATAGGSVYGTGTALAVTAAGTSGQFLQSNGASAPTWASVTASAPYDLRGMFVGNPASSAIIDRFVADRAATISTTSTNHKFSAGSLPSAGVVVLTVQRTRTVLGVPATVVVFTATSASTDTILNGYYPLTISAVTNGDVIENDVLEVVVQVGAVNASFATIVYTISAVA